MLKRFVLLCLLFSLTNAVFAQTDTVRKPIIIDTDMASDDWMAILYLLQRTDVEVRAITVTGTGEAHCDPGIQNVLNVIALAGNPDIPVTCGRETPLETNHVFPDAWRERSDALENLVLPQNPNPPSDLNAVELLIDQINASAENITLLTLGPLTNIAEAFQADPALINKIDMIYIMGGAVNVAGNVQYGGDTDNTTAEWNLYIDPLAAEIVFQSGAPITLVPLDATNYVPMTTSFYNRIERDRTTPEADFVYQTLTASLDGINAGTLSFWDSLSAVALTEASVISVQGRPLHVITDESAESGRTSPDGGGNRIDVAVSADTAAFERIFLNVLNGRDPSADLPVQITVAAGSEANAVIVQRYYEEVWGAQNWDTMTELLDEGYLNHSNTNSFASDRQTLQGTIAILHTAAPDLRITIQEIIVVGDTAAVRVMLEGTHTGAFLALSPSNNPITLTINSMIHLANGRIVEEWQTFDFLGFLISVGVLSEDDLSAMYGEGQ